MTTALETPLKRVLREQGRRQTWLAMQLGVRPNSVHYWVNGLFPPADKRKRIAEILEVDEEQLWPTS